MFKRHLASIINKVKSLDLLFGNKPRVNILVEHCWGQAEKMQRFCLLVIMKVVFVKSSEVKAGFYPAAAYENNIHAIDPADFEILLRQHRVKVCEFINEVRN